MRVNVPMQAIKLTLLMCGDPWNFIKCSKVALKLKYMNNNNVLQITHQISLNLHCFILQPSPFSNFQRHWHIIQRKFIRFLQAILLCVCLEQNYSLQILDSLCSYTTKLNKLMA